MSCPSLNGAANYPENRFAVIQDVTQFLGYTNEHHSVLLSSQGSFPLLSGSISSMWALGSNGHSQLSLRHRDDVSIPSPCHLPEELEHASTSEKKDWRITCGGNHTFLLTRNGSLYGCGSNESHQLGIHESVEDVPSLTRLHSFRRWKHVACGFDFSILVSVDDEIHSTGFCDKGSLGQGEKIKSSDRPRRVELDLHGQHVVAIQAALHHVVLVLSDGTVYGCGTGRKGTLGDDFDGPVFSFKQIDAWTITLPMKNDKFAGKTAPLATGVNWTALLDDKTVCIYGDCRQWPALTSRETSSRRFPVEDVLDLQSNWSTLHILHASGMITSFGRFDHGQLKPQGVGGVRALASGSEHSLAISSDGKSVYAWGWNEHGNCADIGTGLGDVKTKRKLIIPGLEEICGIAAGYGTSFVW